MFPFEESDGTAERRNEITPLERAKMAHFVEAIIYWVGRKVISFLHASVASRTCFINRGKNKITFRAKPIYIYNTVGQQTRRASTDSAPYVYETKTAPHCLGIIETSVGTGRRGNIRGGSNFVRRLASNERGIVVIQGYPAGIPAKAFDR